MKDKTSAKAYLAKWLISRERTVLECKKRLEEKGYSSHEVSTTVAWARENHFLDDERYAENFIEITAKKRNMSAVLIHRKLAILMSKV